MEGGGGTVGGNRTTIFRFGGVVGRGGGIVGGSLTTIFRFGGCVNVCVGVVDGGAEEGDGGVEEGDGGGGMMVDANILKISTISIA